MSIQSFLPPCDEILAVMKRIYRFRMTTTSGGNVSLRDEAGNVWITPARVDKGSFAAPTSSASIPMARTLGRTRRRRSCLFIKRFTPRGPTCGPLFMPTRSRSSRSA